MKEKGNCLVAEAGGPWAVINASLYGVIEEARKYRKIDKTLGSRHGIEGMLNDEIVDLGKEDRKTIEGLKKTPGAALGGTRTRLRSSKPVAHSDLRKAFDVLKKYNVKYLFYLGGNDSMDTAYKLSYAAKEIDYDLQVIGIPKTGDNDLLGTDHCPGYGSAAKYVAASVREAGLHTESMYTAEPITILVTVGRNTGWLPAASALAQRGEKTAPHLIYLPEVPLNREKFLADVEKTCTEVGGAFIVTGEGLVDEKGRYLEAEDDEVSKDGFGHPELGGVGEYLEELIQKNLKRNARTVKLDICQQSAMHFASKTDLNEAIMLGRRAVNYALLKGKSGMMVTLQRKEKPYHCRVGSIVLEEVANKERKFPSQWINKGKNYVTPDFLNYVRPLILGEVHVPIEGGLPTYTRLKMIKATP